MHDDKPFYITLPSDASMESYPQNTCAEYTTKLKHAINLKGNWEVALVELQYLNSIFTLRERQVILVLHETEWKEGPKIGLIHLTQHIINVEPGDYQDPNDLLVSIRNQIPRVPVPVLKPNDDVPETMPAFAIDFVSEKDQRVRISVLVQGVGVQMNSKQDNTLRQILGFDQDGFAWDLPRTGNKIDKPAALASREAGIYIIEGKRPVNTILGLQSMFVYCDIADYSLVGDTSAQILRIAPIKGKPKELVTERFDSPHYVPILPSHFDTIHVQLCNDLGDNIKFSVGKSIVKLHFRRARYY